MSRCMSEPCDISKQRAEACEILRNCTVTRAVSEVKTLVSGAFISSFIQIFKYVNVTRDS